MTAFISDMDIMRSYVIDTLFGSEYYIGDAEEIETTEEEVRQAFDSAQLVAAIKREVCSLLGDQEITLKPITKKLGGHGRLSEQPSNASGRRNPMENQISKHKARAAAARGDTFRRAIAKANVPLLISYSSTFALLFHQLAVIQQLHLTTMVDIKSAYSKKPPPLSPRGRMDRDHIGTAHQLCVRPRPLPRIPHRNRIYYMVLRPTFLSPLQDSSTSAKLYDIHFNNCLYVLSH